jgi:hypothetical protein
MGKKKRNALKHGANAKEVMLWSERYEDYEALRDALYQEFTPFGSTCWPGNRRLATNRLMNL